MYSYNELNYSKILNRNNPLKYEVNFEVKNLFMDTDPANRS